MKYSKLYKFFAFFIAAQFLNVQIQTAYGTEAITGANPELKQALKEMESKIQTRVDGMSEKAQLRFAYRLYKTDVKLRNKVFNKTDQEIQQRIEDLAQGKVSQQSEVLSEEDQELAQTLSSEQAFNDLASAQKIKVSFNRSSLKKEQLLNNSDPLLLDLGSELNEDGTFSKATFQNFQNKVFELNKAQESRGPASLNVLVKIILALLIVAAGLGILYFVVIVIVLTAVFGGSLTPFGTAVLVVLTAGSIVGMIFGLKAVFSSNKVLNSRSALSFA